MLRIFVCSQWRILESLVLVGSPNRVIYSQYFFFFKLAIFQAMLLSPQDIAVLGLSTVERNFRHVSHKQTYAKFRSHFGSSPLDLASMWYDMCNLPDIVSLPPKQKSRKGAKSFLMAHYFLWTYPKNAKILASTFGICECLARGKYVWDWVERIAALKEAKIVWPDSFDSPDGPTFILSVDGTDCRTWEKKDKKFPRDKKACSKKFNKYALKYEIAIALWEPKVVSVRGPYKGAVHDNTIFQEEGGVCSRMRPGKRGMADLGYQGNPNLGLPRNTRDPKELRKFKSRGRCRHETFNGRIKKFRILDDTYKHDKNKHHLAFFAVCVTVQYQMDNGAEIFEV